MYATPFDGAVETYPKPILQGYPAIEVELAAFAPLLVVPLELLPYILWLWLGIWHVLSVVAATAPPELVPDTAWEAKAVVKFTVPPVPPPVVLTIRMAKSVLVTHWVHPVGAAACRNIVLVAEGIDCAAVV